VVLVGYSRLLVVVCECSLMDVGGVRCRWSDVFGGGVGSVIGEARWL